MKFYVVEIESRDRKFLLKIFFKTEMGSFCVANFPIVSAWIETLLKNTSIAWQVELHLTTGGLHSYQDFSSF